MAKVLVSTVELRLGCLVNLLQYPSKIRLRLYISKSIVEAHGGKIWAEKNEDEKGDTFGFSLPLNEN